MVAKKVTKATVARPFIFRKEWVFDEVPPWVVLDRTAQTKIKQLKEQFVKEVNAAISKGQR